MDGLRLLGYALAAYFLYSLLLAIYNVWFHPLRKIPGPKIYAAFAVPYVWASINGTVVSVTADMHTKYGPVVRIAPGRVDFIDPQAWEDIYSSRTRPQFMKDEEAYRYAWKTKSMQVAHGASHARQRKLVSHAFSNAALQEQEPTLQHYINTMMQMLRERAFSKSPSEPVTMDAKSWFSYVAFDIIGDLTLGQSFGCLEQQEFHPWINAIFGSLRVAVITAILYSYPFPFLPFNLWVRSTVGKGLQKHKQFVRNAVDTRLANKAPRNDFMAQISKHSGEKGMSQEELYDNFALLVGAGSETVATALCGIFYNMLVHPSSYEKAAMEVRTTFEKESDITMLGLNNKLPYSTALMNEAMRMYPPSPVALWRRVVAKEGAMVAGYWMPKNTCVGVTQYAAYHSPLNFTDPEKFIPERWFPTADEEFPQDRKNVFMPFSFGPANCVGQKLAWLEVKLVFAKLLWNFDFEPIQHEEKPWVDQQTYAVWQKSSLNLGYKVRPL